VDTLKTMWKPTEASIEQILQVIRCLLIYPNPDSALNEEAGKILMENYGEFKRRAKLCT